MTKHDRIKKAIFTAFAETKAAGGNMDTACEAATVAVEAVLESYKRAPDPIFEALVAACGGNLEELTDMERGRYNKAAGELRKVNATPEEIIKRAKRYGYLHKDWELTPLALVSHWSELKTTLLRAPEADEPEPAEEELITITPEMLAQLRSVGREMPTT